MCTPTQDIKMGFIFSLFKPVQPEIKSKSHNDLFDYDRDFNIESAKVDGGILIGDNIIHDPDILWFYSEYTLGRELWGNKDLLNVWSLDKIMNEHKDNGISFSTDCFYFADVLIWSHSLYFKLELGKYSVYVDYGQKAQIKVANDPREFISNLIKDWNGTIYPDLKPSNESLHRTIN